MSGWKAKRFWKEATVVAEGDLWAIHLDGRLVKTPSKVPLLVPTKALAEAIAAEWDAQQGEIKPATMPFTRSANSAIDKVAVQFDAVAEMITEYGGTDLLCYRAGAPEALVARQVAAWDPVLDWSREVLQAPLAVTTGLVPIAQDPQVLARLLAEVRSFDTHGLTALHDLVGISGSLILGLAVTHGAISVDQAWDASRIDETWQIEVWGGDEEAEAIEANKRRDLTHAARFYEITRP